MASDRGQNRYSDFVALETLLRFENCSSSHCLLSSWRRFHVFESSHLSFHRTVFFESAVVFVTSVPCLRVVASLVSSYCFLRVIVCCLRGVGSMSSSRRIPRFIVPYSSGHRCVVAASFLCLRVVGLCLNHTVQKDSREVLGTSFRFGPTSEILENIQYGGSSVVKTDSQRSRFIPREA